MQEAENVSDYCVRVKDAVNKMATLGEIVDKEVLIKNVFQVSNTKVEPCCHNH
jgi:hypothetical protein